MDVGMEGRKLVSIMRNRFDGIPVCVSGNLAGPDCAVWMDGKIQVSQELFDRMTGCESQEELKALLDGLTVLNFGDGFMKEPLFIGVDWADGEPKPSPLRPECPVRFH